MGRKAAERTNLKKITKLDFLIEEGIKNDFAHICKSRGQTMTWVLNQMVQQFIKTRKQDDKKARRSKAETTVN